MRSERMSGLPEGEDCGETLPHRAPILALGDCPFNRKVLILEQGHAMTKRGKVLRDPTAGPGLLMVEGQQYLFALEPVWKSDVPPKPGLVVDVDLDGSGKIQAITVVPES